MGGGGGRGGKNEIYGWWGAGKIQIDGLSGELFNCEAEVVESKFVLMGGGGCNILKFMSGEIQVQKKKKTDGWW